MKIKSFNNIKKTSFFLVFILFFPAKNYEVYISLQAILLLFLYQNDIEINLFVQIVFMFIFYIILTSLIRYLQVFYNSFRDFKESFRYVPLLIFFAYKQSLMKINSNEMKKIFGLYIFLDFCLSFMQFFKINMSSIKFITNLYATIGHSEISLGVAGRAIGLSTGPGTHGAILVVLSIYFLCEIFFYEKKVKLNFLLFILAVSSLFFSQSQTSFIALTISIFIMLFSFILKGNKRQKKISIRFILILILICVLIIILVPVVFDFINVLLKYGINRSSYLRRVSKWSHYIISILEKPEWLIIGHGKDYFGRESRAMDNEYIYFLSIYGVHILLTVLSFGLLYILKNLIFKKKINNIDKLRLSITIIGGLVIGWPSSFLLDTRILIIIAYYIILLDKNTYEYINCPKGTK